MNEKMRSCTGLTHSDLLQKMPDRKRFTEVTRDAAKKMNPHFVLSELLVETATDVGWQRDRKLVHGFKENALTYLAEKTLANRPHGFVHVRVDLYRNQETGALYERCETVSGEERFRLVGVPRTNLSFGER